MGDCAGADGLLLACSHVCEAICVHTGHTGCCCCECLAQHFVCLCAPGRPLPEDDPGFLARRRKERNTTWLIAVVALAMVALLATLLVVQYNHGAA